MIRSYGPPDNTTPGNVGDLYYDLDTDKIYRCKEVKKPVDEYHGFITVSDSTLCDEYVWEAEAGAGAGGGTISSNFGKYSVDGIRIDNAGCSFPSPMVSATNLIVGERTDFSDLFYGQTELTTVSGLDLRNATNVDKMFFRCPALTNLEISNIRLSIGLASEYLDSYENDDGDEIETREVWECALTDESLANVLNALVPSSDGYLNLMLGNNGYANATSLYCKITDSSDPMLPMVLCSSSDPDAISAEEYAEMKKWSLSQAYDCIDNW